MLEPRIHVRQLFDRQVIRRNWKAINESPAKKAGLLVRRIAINSLKRVKHGRPSPPGKPPFSHAWRYVPGKNGKQQKNKAPLQLIYSVPEMLGTRVIVGPVGFGDAHPVPEVHEKGLTVIRSVIPRGARWHQRARRAVKYPERPTMRPALEKALDKLPPMWRNSLSN